MSSKEAGIIPKTGVAFGGRILIAAAGLLCLSSLSFAYTFSGDFSLTGRAVFDGQDARGYAIAVDTLSAGAPYVYVAGDYFNGTDRDIVVIKYDAGGTKLAHQFYDSGSSCNDYARGIAVNTAGEIFVAGYTSDPGNGNSEDMLILKFPPSFVAPSKKVIGQPNQDDEANALALAPDGTVYVAGFSEDTSNVRHFAVVKISPDLATFETMTPPSGATSSEAKGIAIMPTGMSTYDIVATGSANSKDMLTVRMAYDLTNPMEHLFPAMSTGSGEGVCIDPQNNDIIVAGFLNTQPVVLRYAPAVTLKSSTTFETGSALAKAYDVNLDSQRNVFVAGTVFKSGTTDTGDAFVARYSPELAMLTAPLYDSSVTDTGHGVAAGAGEQAYVTGFSENGGQSNSSLMWTRRIDFSGEADVTPPAAITGLKAESVPGTAAANIMIKLSWNMPGDDGMAGALPIGSEYRILCSTNSTGPWNLAYATPQNLGFAANPGDPVSVTLPSPPGLGGMFEPNRFYYFMIWFKDAFTGVPGNWSAGSNTARVLGQIQTGAPQFVRFDDRNRGEMVVLKGQRSNAIRLVAYDMHNLVTKATETIPVSLAAQVTGVSGGMNMGTPDPNGVFYNEALTPVSQVSIAPGASEAVFYYMTASTGMTVIQASCTVNSLMNLDWIQARVIESSIRNLRLIKGANVSTATMVMSPGETVNICFDMPSSASYQQWQVLISSSADHALPLWTFNGYGNPYPGQIIWNGKTGFCDPVQNTWREENASKGTYYVRIKLGWSSSSVTEDSLRIVIQSREISGRVTDNGTGIPFAYVNAYGPVTAYTRTDADGYYRLSGLVEGSYCVNVHHDGYIFANYSGIPSDSTLNVVMKKPSYVKINARRSMPGAAGVTAPDMYAIVNVTGESFESMRQGTLHFAVDVSTSDNNFWSSGDTPKYEIENSTDNPWMAGRWTIIEVASGTYTLSASLDGYQPVSREITVRYGETLVLNDILFELKKTVTGAVTLPQTVDNPQYISIEVTPQGSRYPTAWSSAVVNTGSSSGTFTVFGLNTGTHTVTARAAGWQKGTVSVCLNAEVVTAPDIALTAGGQLTGTVRVEGDTLDPALSITGDPYSLYINAWSPENYAYGWTEIKLPRDGIVSSTTFTINGLEDGKYWINSWLDGFELQGAIGYAGVVAQVTNGTGNLDIRFKRHIGRICARILIPAGGDYADVTAYLEGGMYGNTSWQNGVPISSAADLGGSFDYSSGTLRSPLLGTGAFRIRAVYNPTGVERAKYVMVTNGQVTDTLLDLRGETYAVSGKVILDQNNPPVGFADLETIVASAPCSAYNTMMINGVSTTTLRVFALDYRKLGTDGMTDSKSCPIAADGTYRVANLAPGVYILVVPQLEMDNDPSNGCETALIERKIIIADRDVAVEDLELNRGYAVKGAVKLPTGEDITAAVCELNLRISYADTAKTIVHTLGNMWKADIASFRVNFDAGEQTKEFQINGFSPGEYVLALDEAGTSRRYANAALPVTVRSEDSAGNTLQLTKGGKIIFKIRDASSGVFITPRNKDIMLPWSYGISAAANPWVEGGMHVLNTGDQDLTRSYFELNYLPEGTYDLVLGQSSYGTPATAGTSSGNSQGNQTSYAAKTITSMTVKNGMVVDAGTIDIYQGKTISGSVKDGSGNGIPNIPVVAVPSLSNEWSSELRGFTDINGKFSIPGISPEHEYYDIIACPRIDPKYFGNYFFFGSGGLKYGEKTRTMVAVNGNLPVDFVLDEARGSVSGTIATEDGGAFQNPEDQNLPTARIYLQREDSFPRTNPLGDIVSDTETDGSFSLEALAPGNYRMIALSGGYASYSSTVTVGSADIPLGTITLRQGARVSGAIAKPDGSNPSTDELRSITAATDDLSEVIMGSFRLSGDKTVIGYDLNGMQAGTPYNIMFLNTDDDLVPASLGYSVPFSTYVKTDNNLTYQIQAPAVFSRVKKEGESFLVYFDITAALRNSVSADNDLEGIIVLASGAGTISDRYLSPNRKMLSCRYTPAAGETQFTLRVRGYAAMIDPRTGASFGVDESFICYSGVGARNSTRLSNLRGGKVTLEGDVSSVRFVPGSFEVITSTESVQVDFARAEKIEDFAAAAPARKGGRFSIQRSAASYPSRLYKAMRFAQDAGIDPFSSFYDIMLPAGISHALKKKATLTLQYSATDDPSDLNVYYYDERNNVYLREDTDRAVNADEGTITISIGHASVFTVLRASARVIQGDAFTGNAFAYAFPNPCMLGDKQVTLVNAGNQVRTIRGAMIHYGLPVGADGEIEIRVYTVAGDLVRSISDGRRAGGAHYYVEWDGANDAGNTVASGVYIGYFTVDKKRPIAFKMAIFN